MRYHVSVKKLSLPTLFITFLCEIIFLLVGLVQHVLWLLGFSQGQRQSGNLKLTWHLHVYLPSAAFLGSIHTGCYWQHYV